MNIKALVVGLVLWAMSATVSAVDPKPFSIERSEVITFSSSLFDRSYDLYVKVPRSFDADPNRRYPMLFLNDGGYAFPLASSIIRQMAVAVASRSR